MENANGSDETASALAMFAGVFLAFLPSILLALAVDIAGGVAYLHRSFDPRGSREGIALIIAFGGWFVMGAMICWAWSRLETEKIPGTIVRSFCAFNAVMWSAVIGALATAMFIIPVSVASAEEKKTWSGELSIEPLRYAAPEITFTLKGGDTLKIESVEDIEVVQEGGRGFREGFSNETDAVQNLLSVFTFYYTKGVNADLGDQDLYFRGEKLKRVSATTNGDLSYMNLTVRVRTATKDYRLKFIKEVEDGKYCCILHYVVK